MTGARLDWERDGADWPNREHSRFVAAGGVRWHVQVFGHGPVLLLLHGAGASTHSWRDLAPALARRFTVVAPDLPGHAFTARAAGAGMSLPGMARGVGSLLAALEKTPALAGGHSAGAAILARMILDGIAAPAGLVSLNGAFLPIGGALSPLFSAVARVMSLSSLPAQLFAWRAGDRAVVLRLLRDTGSAIDKRGVELYARLAANAGHVDGTLQMMANWDLGGLERDLPRLKTPLTLATGLRDRTIRPATAYRVRELVAGATVVPLENLGHLAHEEDPDRVADLFFDAAAALGIAKPAKRRGQP